MHRAADSEIGLCTQPGSDLYRVLAEECRPWHLWPKHPWAILTCTVAVTLSSAGGTPGKRTFGGYMQPTSSSKQKTARASVLEDNTNISVPKAPPVVPMLSLDKVSIHS